MGGQYCMNPSLCPRIVREFLFFLMLVSFILKYSHSTEYRGAKEFKIFGGRCQFFIFLFHRLVGIESHLRWLHFSYSTLLGGWCGREVAWRIPCFIAALMWLWSALKSAEELSHSSQWGSTMRTLVNRPMGRFAWTNHIYFQITQPGSSPDPRNCWSVQGLWCLHDYMK